MLLVAPDIVLRQMVLRLIISGKSRAQQRQLRLALKQAAVAPPEDASRRRRPRDADKI
jgi:hypothetical protein